MSDADLSMKVKEAADIIMRRAKELSSWSVRIPISLEAERDGADAVVISSDPNIAPQAKAFERGLRHPLNYPSQRRAGAWGPTPHRPFLARAVDEQEGAAVEKVAQVIDVWSYKLGFK